MAAAAFVVAISEYNRRVILAHCEPGDGAKVQDIHCGVDLARFRTAHRNQDATGDRLRVVCVGTLHAVKGQSLLIEALARLRIQGLDVELVLVGDGPDQRCSETCPRQPALPKPSCSRAVHQPEVAQILANADILAAPSVPTPDGRREGIPVALMEGMACRLPVVASEVSGIPELVRHAHNGLLIAPGSVEMLANALHSLALDPGLRTRLGSAARRTIEAEFDIKASAARLTELFLFQTQTA